MKYEFDITFENLRKILSENYKIRKCFDFSQLGEDERIHLCQYDGHLIEYMYDINLSEACWEAAVGCDPDILQYYIRKYGRNPSLKIQQIAVNTSFASIQYILNPSLDMILEGLGNAVMMSPSSNVVEVFIIKRNNAIMSTSWFPWTEEFQEWFIDNGGDWKIIPIDRLSGKYSYLKDLRKAAII